MEATFKTESIYKYIIDPSKIETIEDVRKIIKIMNIILTEEAVQEKGLQHLVKLIEDESRSK